MLSLIKCVERQPVLRFSSKGCVVHFIVYTLKTATENIPWILQAVVFIKTTGFWPESLNFKFCLKLSIIAQAILKVKQLLKSDPAGTFP